MSKLIHLIKSVLILIATMNWATIGFAQKKDVGFKPHIGFVRGKALDICPIYGINFGGQFSIPIRSQFSINPEISFIYLQSYESNMNTLLMPIYASYKVPIQQMNLNFNVGPCIQLTHSLDVGVSMKMEVEYNRWITAFNGSINFLDNTNPHILGLSVGYKFSLN